MADKIRILLVDDNPEFTRDELNDRLFLSRSLEPHFELIWIEEATEARWLLDAFEILSIRAPGKLLEAGFPPEMLIFDYALTHSPPRPRSASEDTYRIDRRIKHIQALARDARIMLPFAGPRNVPVPPGTGAARGEDRTGCYIGGALARVFSAHPCGMVPTTAHVDTADTDAAFYQWLNEHFFMDLFKHKFRTKPTWKILLPLAAESLQERIVQLAASGIIRVQLQTLQEMAAEAPDTAKLAVVLHSRFGRRALPVEGLFIKYLYPGDPPQEKEFAGAARKWACRVLAGLFSGRGQDQFNVAKHLTQQYWAAYLSDTKRDRYDLSELMARRKRTPNQEAEIDEICTRLGLNADTVRKLQAGASIPPEVSMLNWKAAVPNDEVARWVALMLAVRMEQDSHGAAPYEEHEGNYGHSRVEKYLEKNRVPELRKATIKKKVVDDLLERPAKLEDILAALDPLPQHLFTFYQKRKSKKGLTKETTYLTNPLKHLGRTDKSWGNLGLNLADVLADRPFDCDGCQQAIHQDEAPPEHEGTEWRYFHHGIRKGEGLLLQIYADEIGFPEAKWPVWLRNAP
jgi:hypothetical protein